MDRENFIQSSVRIRYAEKKLLTKQQLERLADSKTLEDAIRLLNETVYSSEISKLERSEDYETVLSTVLNQTYKDVLEISPEKSLVDILFYKYGYHNLKVLAKENILNEKFNSMYCMLNETEIEHFRQSVLENDDYFSKDYFECLKLFEETKDPQDIDIFIDKKYFEKVLSLTEEFNLDMINEYFKAMVDFINLRTFIRCKKQNQEKDVLEKALIMGGEIEVSKISDLFFSEIEQLKVKFKSYKIGRALSKIVDEYKETSSMQSFEKYMDDYLTEIIKKTKSIHYGAEVVFAYLCAKELEIKNLRLILVGKINDLSSEFIRERLREVYV
ncbi:MAG: V-type ATP synthase subunit C [Peptoniphilaceae bacterium]|uniref:V-type ATP synthase subunit C n=1 Tax=Parvimonas sp. TaxID=1944660 RepID=UPI0025D6FD2F|nr:V-type ATP synthase subunit C [Parvimonas sp.]MCI5997196.1 V-type ATP synthase subunit C [Parvimonas sp.]MDD7764289.1 V-type ATP synthase subunit C [Peptoniphilaceae bacterium]MDY3051552.1 V-type ATP synthase subunit C [Parvimonas sp.]